MIIGEQDQTGESTEQDQSGEQDYRRTGPDWWHRTEQDQTEGTGGEEQDQTCGTGEGVAGRGRTKLWERQVNVAMNSHNQKAYLQYI